MSSTVVVIIVVVVVLLALTAVAGVTFSRKQRTSLTKRGHQIEDLESLPTELSSQGEPLTVLAEPALVDEIAEELAPTPVNETELTSSDLKPPRTEGVLHNTGH